MKVIIQIPCFNEEETLPQVIRDLPTSIAGVDTVEYLIIDDGSTDNTVAVARKIGVHHIVHLPYNQGLANSFRAGIDACLNLGADIVVNTDGDNQYAGDDIANLVRPIIEGKAGLVLGERPIMQTKHFSPIKKILQRTGSWFMRVLSKTSALDAPSGFRAMSKAAILQFNLVSEYTYTLESLIQIGWKKIPLVNVPVKTNEKTRESRLMKSMTSYITRSLTTMIRVWLTYNALVVFTTIGVVFLLAATGIGVRFLYFFFQGFGQGNIQSLILLAVFAIIGIQMIAIGMLADTIATNRKIIEDANLRIKQLALTAHAPLAKIETVRQKINHGSPMQDVGDIVAENVYVGSRK